MEFHQGHYFGLVFIAILIKQLSSLPAHNSEGAPRKLADADRITFSHLGQSLELVCPIEMDTPETTTQIFVEWSRAGQSLYNERGFQVTRKGTLKIKSVSTEHAGTYTCEAVNGYGATLINLTLIVDHPEKESENKTIHTTNTRNRLHLTLPIIRKQTPTIITDEVGGQATFHCVATGHPPPHVFWLKDGHLLSGADTTTLKGRTHSTLRLQRLEKGHSGLYNCIARNKAGATRVNYTLKVTDGHAPRIRVEPLVTIVQEGEAAVFWCEVTSKPGVKLHVKWLKKQNEDEDLSDNLFRSGMQLYRLLNSSDLVATEEVSKTKLLLRNTKVADSGTYVCLALNDKGYSYKDVSLTVMGTDKASKSAPMPLYLSSTGMSYILIAPLLCIALLGVGVFFYCKSRRNNGL